MNIKITLMMVLGVLAALQSHALDLVKDGQPLATIVLPADPVQDQIAQTQATTNKAKAKPKPAKPKEDDELLAAEELQSIIEKISGAKLPIQRGGAMPAGPAIVLGNAYASEAGFGKEIGKLTTDGILCVVKGNALYLSGQRPRGTLYAAYDFLESLGCRWVMPGPFGELYPSMKTISTAINKTENPSHSERYWWCTYGNAEGYVRWTLRNKGNFLKVKGDPVIEQGHNLSTPMAWGKKQPKYLAKKMVDGTEVSILPDEYYSIVNGKPSGQNPNFSNPKVWDMYADYFIDYFTKNPGKKYASISAEDGLVIDERPESRKLDSDDFDWMAGAYSSTDKLWYFHNQVLDRVAKVFPEKKFGVLVYSNNMMPPKKSKVHRNMALVFAPLTVCPLHDVRDPKCKTNRTYAQWLPEWMRQARAVGAETFYYDYEPLGFSWNVAMICPRWGIIGKNYPWFKSMGLTGHTTQGHDDWASCGLDNYLMQKLYWNANLNYKDVIADYCKVRFGASAPAMIEYYATYEKRMDEVTDLYGNEVWANHLVLTPEVRKAAREILKRAVAMADSERAKAQLQTMVDLQESTDAACDAEEIVRNTGDYGQAAKSLETVFAVRDRLNALYPKFMNPSRVDRKEKNQYLTGGIYNQYLDFDKKIKEAAAYVVLPRMWKGMLDTEAKAEQLGYQKPGADVEKLDDLDTTVMPDVKYGTEREEAAFFYRTQTEVPASFGGKQVSMFCSSLIARRVQIWINGQAVEFTKDGKTSTTWNGPEYFWYDYNHAVEFDLTPYIKAGQGNTIAMRVLKSHDVGGSYRRIFLLAK
ncbi:MAG: DUF4838 domain-containing protein [bacterium]